MQANLVVSGHSSNCDAGTASTSTNACAACRFQRRKCAPNCLLRPYFPPDKPRQFLNVHKLFGVHNIIKTLTGLRPEDRDNAVKAMIYTANARAKDPVGGCWRIILELRRQIDECLQELVAVQQQLAFFRSLGRKDGGFRWNVHLESLSDFCL